MAPERYAKALPHPDVWRGGEGMARALQCVDTGVPALSAQLPGGGWPRGALVEILLPQPGAGEWQLLRPALLQGHRSILLIRPPYVLQAAAWSQAGGDIGRLLWLRGVQDGEALWAAEQGLRCGALDAVLLWQGQADYRQLHRLHLAAQDSQSLFFMLRPVSLANQASPAALRLALERDVLGKRWQARILKRRGGWGARPVALPFMAGQPVAAVHKEEAHASVAVCTPDPSRSGCLSLQYA